MSRVCVLLNVTEFELATICAIPFEQWGRWKAAAKGAGLFPSYVALQFKQLESWYLQRYERIPQDPVMPIHLLAK